MLSEQQRNVMSEGYWKLWNPDVQAKIDRDIETNRKADASIAICEIPEGTPVNIKQVSHSFIFGAHIFNFDQLGSKECNDRYKNLYGSLFNSATIAFYWQPFEPIEGKPRFEPGPEDSPEFWATCPNPKMQFNWRRPATDPVVDFCESRGIRLHGHTLVWANKTWQYPRWLMAKLPKEILVEMLTDVRCGTNIEQRTPVEFAERFPEFVQTLRDTMDRRIRQIAARYGNRIHSWDVCNESVWDFKNKSMRPEWGVTKSNHGSIMPGDYTYNAFRIAKEVFPENAKLNINDFALNEYYANQTLDLIKRGCKVDIMGAQMHLFNPQTCLDIANGVSCAQSPDSVWNTMSIIGKAGLPIHLSEITITAPNNDERGQAIQAVIARNLYRLWFSIKPMMGITWWNVVDDCGAPGEPSVSGIMSRDLSPKPAFFALDNLINHEWKTQTTVEAGRDGRIEFRGFRGTYKLSWIDKNGCEQIRSFNLN